MPSYDETRDDSARALDSHQRARPGLVFLLLAGAPSLVTLEVSPLGIELGRGVPNELLEADDRISRRHVRLRRAQGGWVVTDLDSRNGTFVDGQPLRSESTFAREVLIRIGRTLVWAVDDLAPFRQRAQRQPADAGPVLGGRLQRAWSEIALASRAGTTLYVRGESGSGKELAAQAFHEARFGVGSKAPFVAVNCAAIPEGLAERLLFGAQRGAYSGANVDAEGYVQAAHRGTLFLDEIAELDPLVQSKLLRVLEAREVLPLGATKPRSVDIAVCVASHKSLRDEVGKSRFREDLYFRLGRPEVQLPPLRERLDELPWLITRELLGVDPQLAAGVGFVEACALRPWPGNVRELLLEVRRAGHAALQERAGLVEPHHLATEAGTLLVGPSADPPTVKMRAKPPTDDEIVRALDENEGNVRGTARALGIHRNQLRRWLEKRGQSADSQD
ncbi:MAG: sigma 54-interacting transcriptional regulator [Polyangiales bacterium]